MEYRNNGLRKVVSLQKVHMKELNQVIRRGCWKSFVAVTAACPLH
jgi:hypothetical protein